MRANRYLRLGLTVTLTACAIMVFYDTVFRNGVLLRFLHILFHALAPVIYGAAMAYLLAPVVDFFDRLLLPRMGGRRGPVRALSILLTWSLVFLLLYGLLSVLIPQLYNSIRNLVGNMQTYYRTVYNWVVQLSQNNPDISARVTEAVSDYYLELRRWFTDSFLPQAQETIGILTGGILTVLGFFMNFFVGMVVSVYLLALKERFAVNSRRLLFSFASERHYSLLMGAVTRVDRIFSGFVRGKLLDSLIIGILCFFCASLLSLPYTPLVSVIVGVTNIIPFFGPFLGAIPSAFLILLVSPVKCLYFVIMVLVLQQLDGNFIGPKILGGSTELPSFWVIVAILVGGGFFGAVGMFLGVPVFACFYALVRYYSERRLQAKGIDGEELFLSNDAVRIYRPKKNGRGKGQSDETPI